MNVEIDGKAIFDPPYRLRVGNYRVLFDIEDNTITVYRVRHRKESYK